MDNAVKSYLMLFKLQNVLNNPDYLSSIIYDMDECISFSFYNDETKNKINGSIAANSILINNVSRKVISDEEIRLETIFETRNIYSIFKDDNKVLLENRKIYKHYELYKNMYIPLHDYTTIETYDLPIDPTIDFRNGIIKYDKSNKIISNEIDLKQKITTKDLTDYYNSIKNIPIKEKKLENDHIYDFYLNIFEADLNTMNKLYFVDENDEYHALLLPKRGACIGYLNINNDSIEYKILNPIFGRGREVKVLHEHVHRIFKDENGIIRYTNFVYLKEAGNHYYTEKNGKNYILYLKNDIDFKTLTQIDDIYTKKRHF